MPERSRACPYCAEPVDAEATRCPACGEYLSWRGPATVQRGGSGLKVAMVLVAIMALLVCLWCVGFGYWAARMTPQMTTQAAVLMTLSSVQSGLEAYKRDVGEYPATLADLTQPPATLPPGGTWNGPYGVLTADPWGRPILYTPLTTRSGYTIACWGKDGKPGGTGVDSDFILNNRNTRFRPQPAPVGSVARTTSKTP